MEFKVIKRNGNAVVPDGMFKLCGMENAKLISIENTASTITEWSENAVRQTVERVTVLSADEVLVRIKSGAEIKQRLTGK